MSSDASKKRKKTSPHPPYAEMVKAAVAALKDRKGSSRQKIGRYLKDHYKADETSSHFKSCLKRLVADDQLVQTKGKGASGSFKLSKPKSEPKTKTVAQAKKTAAKKTVKKAPTGGAAKKPASKKATTKSGSKKTSVKKSSPKKSSAKKSPVKKAAAKKKTAAASKKTKKPAAKKVAKKPAAKKSGKK